MAPEREAPKCKRTNTRAQPDPHFSIANERCEIETLSLDMQNHALEIVAVGTLSNTAPEAVLAARRHRNLNSSRFITLRTISHARTAPQFPQAFADKRTRRQTLTSQYDVHKRNTRIRQFSQQAVSGVNISRFMQPSSPRSHPRSPPEDLSYSLWRFIVADPVQDANVVYTRIAIKEGHTTAGHVPTSLWPRCAAKYRGYSTNGAERDDLEGQ